MIAINIDGKIKIFSAVPKKWNGIHGYNTFETQVHYQDGFREVVRPNLTDTEKLGILIFDAENDVFTYEVLDLSPEEIAEKQERELNSDASATSVQQRRIDGVDAYDKFHAKIERMVKNGTITVNQGISAWIYFDGFIEGLNRGAWPIVQEKMNNAGTVPNGYQSTFTDIKNKVDTYIQDNY